MHHSEVNINNDRMFVVSDEVLERLICSQCKKYLSVKKIKVYPNRGIKCGRCSNAEDAGVVSLFGVLAEQALFRCVNRFEGCNELLSYYDVADHERTCVGKEYECPCCIEQFKGTGYEIYVHFKEQHADRLLVNTPEFILEIDNELAKSYLFRKNDLLFYVDARYSRGEEELILSITYFGTDQEALKISHLFTLHSLDAKVKHKTVRKQCYSVTGGQLKHFKINLSPEDFPKNVVVCRFDLNTENVEKLIALPGNFNNNRQGLGDIGNTIKQSPFGQRRYPVTVYDPPVTRGFMWDSKPSPGYFFDPLKESKPTDSVFTDKFKPVFFGTDPNRPPNQNVNPFLLQPSIFEKDPNNCPPTYRFPHQMPHQKSSIFETDSLFSHTASSVSANTQPTTNLKSATTAPSLSSNTQLTTGFTPRSATSTNSFGMVKVAPSLPSSQPTTTDLKSGTTAPSVSSNTQPTTDLKSATTAPSLYSNPQPTTGFTLGSTTLTNSFGALTTSRPSTQPTTTDSSPFRFTPSGFTFNSTSAGISRPQILKPSKTIYRNTQNCRKKTF